MLFIVLLSMLIKYGVICTSIYLYTIITCTDGAAVYMCACIYTETSKLRINIILLLVFHNVVTYKL